MQYQYPSAEYHYMFDDVYVYNFHRAKKSFRYFHDELEERLFWYKTSESTYFFTFMDDTSKR